MGTGGTDCHSQCAHWLRNDSFFARGAMIFRQEAIPSDGQRRPPLRRTMSSLPPGRCGHRPLRKITRSAVVIGRGDVGIAPYGGETEIHLLSGGRGRTPPLRVATRGAEEESPSHGFAVPAPFRQGGQGDGGCGCSCCGAQNFHAALRRTLKILTAATRSLRFLCHRQRSVRSPQPVCALASQ